MALVHLSVVLLTFQLHMYCHCEASEFKRKSRTVAFGFFSFWTFQFSHFHEAVV